MVRQCDTCENEYDTDSYGVGPRYCSPRCRHGKDGKDWNQREPGRPGRFPRPSSMMKNIVVAKLKADGWRVSSAFNPYGTSPSGTVAKPEDVREKLTRLLQAKGLPVKT